jgi:hypothetical protein
MLNRAIAWVRNAGERRREHTKAFNAVAAIDANGWTVFQAKCIDAVSSHVPPSTFRRVDHDSGSFFLVAPVGGSGAELWIHNVEAGIFGAGRDVRFEEWDFQTPDDLIQAVKNVVDDCA